MSALFVELEKITLRQVSYLASRDFFYATPKIARQYFAQICEIYINLRGEFCGVLSGFRNAKNEVV